jgi:hypothetical protein
MDSSKTERPGGIRGATEAQKDNGNPANLYLPKPAVNSPFAGAVRYIAPMDTGRRDPDFVIEGPIGSSDMPGGANKLAENLDEDDWESIEAYRSMQARKATREDDERVGRTR